MTLHPSVMAVQLGRASEHLRKVEVETMHAASTSRLDRISSTRKAGATTTAGLQYYKRGWFAQTPFAPGCSVRRWGLGAMIDSCPLGKVGES